MALSALQFILAVGGKGFEIPKEGWTAHSFALHGFSLLRTIVRAAQITQRRAAPVVATHAMKVFKLQLERVIAKATGKFTIVLGRKDPAVEIMFPQHESLWRQAIEDVLRETRVDTVLEIVPPIQSVMAQGYSKMGVFLGEEVDADASPAIARNAREIAARVTRINDTTRNQMERIVRGSITDGLTVGETAQRLREQLPQSFANRVLTIARTELNNAWTQGAGDMFQQSRTVSHVSIIGCTAREPESPHYHGESTCNFPDLPVNEIDAFLEVGFHINHTGTMVPSRFRDEDGSMDLQAPRPGLLDDQNQGES